MTEATPTELEQIDATIAELEDQRAGIGRELSAVSRERQAINQRLDALNRTPPDFTKPDEAQAFRAELDTLTTRREALNVAATALRRNADAVAAKIQERKDQRGMVTTQAEVQLHWVKQTQAWLDGDAPRHRAKLVDELAQYDREIERAAGNIPTAEATAARLIPGDMIDAIRERLNLPYQGKNVARDPERPAKEKQAAARRIAVEAEKLVADLAKL